MKDINLQDLRKLLKACRVAHVAELKIGDIEIKFNPGDTGKIIEKSSEIVIPTQLEMNVAEESAAVAKNVTDAEDELAHMYIDDPALYEQLIVERELEDSGRQKETHNTRPE